MKLVKLFANKNFKNIEFDSQFNVVLATIIDHKNKKDTHNLGKTSLIHVINFILIGSFNKNIFGNSIFQNVIFYGELALNNGKFLIIRREIEHNSKISFKLNDTKLNGFVAPLLWDNENIGFDKAREYLNAYLGFDVVRSYDYRKSITYFLRSQQDYLDVFKLDKFKGKHIDWKPFVFELLGYDSNILINKLTLEEEINTKTNIIEVLKEEARINIDDRDKLAGLLDIKESELKEAIETIDKFNFYKQDIVLNKDIVEILDNKIQILNTERYSLAYEINKIEESLSAITEVISIRDLEKLHKEASLYFPNELKKEFSDLISFNDAISKDRKKYLLENLETLKDEFNSINEQLRSLESEKSEKLFFLTDKNSYDKFKEYQKNLSKIEAEVARIKDKVLAIDKSIQIEGDISEIKLKIKEAISDIRTAINKRKHSEINRIFNSIISDILGTSALISINQNKQGNIEYSADYQNPADLITTSEAHGTTYKKLLCMAFDLSLLIHYSKNSFFRFVYHDGILEGLDNRIKLRLLKKVKQICFEFDLQYILSLIDSDTPIDDNGAKYIFLDKEVCLRLSDKDDAGKLFLHSY